MNETDDDLAFEKTAVSVIEELWECTARKLPISYRADFALYRLGRLVAFCEIKVRRNMRDTYPTYMLSLQKWTEVSIRARMAAVPFLLAVRFDDGMLWCDITKLGPGWTIEHGGRQDRGQDGDMEPMVFIPMAAFRPIRPKVASAPAADTAATGVAAS